MRRSGWVTGVIVMQFLFGVSLSSICIFLPSLIRFRSGGWGRTRLPQSGGSRLPLAYSVPLQAPRSSGQAEYGRTCCGAGGPHS